MIKVLVGSALSLLISAPLLALDKRTLHNGQLVLEDIPVIPQEIKDNLNRYQNVRSANFRGWVNNDKSILISTRFGEVSQLHRIDKAGGARHQLTFFDEPIGQVQVQPEHNALAFTMDAGGNEYSQIFMLNLETGSHKMITDGKSRNGALNWNDNGTQLAYQSTERNGQSNDIWVAKFNDTDSIDKSLAIESTDGSWWGPISFNDKDSKLLAQRYISANQSMVYLKNLESDEMSMLAGSEETKSRNYGLDFDSSEDNIFLLTDRYSDFNHLVLHNIKSGKEVVVTKNIPWDINQFVLNDDKSLAAFSSNEGGISKLYLLDTNSLQYYPIKIPLGVVYGISFNKESSKLALVINTPQSPSDVFLLNINPKKPVDSALERWTFSEVGGLNTNKFVVPELVQYPSFDQSNGAARKIPAFVYKPKSRGPHPVIISIHGGPEGQYRPYFSSSIQLWINQLDAAVIAPNVRGSSGYGKDYVALDNGFNREDSVKDIGALLDWIKTQPDLDESRVAVIGGSYGGYMVLASAVHYSDRLKAAVDIVGISNFVTFLKNTKSYRRDLRRVEYGEERDPAMNKHLQAISPNNHVDKITTPMFVVQGENDPRVPVTEATQIVEALRENGQNVWYMNALNEGHGYSKKENRDSYQQATVMFFQKFLLADDTAKGK